VATENVTEASVVQTFLSMLEDRQKQSRLYIVSVGDIVEQQLSLMGVYMVRIVTKPQSNC